MSNQWLPGAAGPQQWNTQAPGSFDQQTQNQGWVQGGTQWQAMQQAPVPPHQQTPYQQSFQATPQFAPSGPQLQGQQVISGNLQGQAHGRGFPQQQAQFQQPQQPMSQHAYIQEQQRLAREEQRVREIEIQKRKLRTMNISGATAANSSIDDLIGLSKLAELSPASQKRAATQKTATSQTHTPEQTQAIHKPRAWTVDSSKFQGVFSQHTPIQRQDDSFGDFQSGGGMISGPQVPHPQMFGAGTNTGHDRGQLPGSKVTPGSLPQPYPQYVSGVGVNPTSSYTHPIPATSVSQVTTQGGVSGGEQRTRALSSPYVPNSGSPSRTLGTPGSTHHSTQVPPVGGYSKGLHEATGATPKLPESGHLNPSSFPPIYMEVYKRCVDKDGSSLSTELLFPVLMSSQLPKSLLGGLWQVANRGTPGKLNQTELFVLLGLIGLAQAGNPSPKFEDLQSAPAPPIPVLGTLANHSSPAVPDVLQAIPNTAQQIKGTATKPATTSPTDDFGSFQQGHLPPTSLSSLPALNPPTIPSSTSILTFDTSKSIPRSTSISSLPASKSTSTPISTFVASIPNTGIAPAVSVATSRPLTPQPDQLPLSNEPSDKYGVFNELRTSTDTSTATSFADFESFVSMPVIAPQKQSEKSPSTDFTSNTAPPVSISSSPGSNQGWADFSAVLVPTSTVAVSSLPTANETLVSAFDTLIPPELKSKATSSVPPSNQLTNSETEIKDNIDPLGTSQPPIKDGTTSGGLLSLDLFEPTPTKTLKPKKQLTGLDILNEEMTARLLSSESSQQPVPSFDDRPLVPESVDEFGDFEAYSSGSPNKGRKVNSSVNNRQEDLSALETNPPTVNSDPCKVWRTCLMKCSEVLETCASVFSATEEKALLDEIAQSKEGRNKLRGIAEVYRVACRVYFSLREKDPAVESADYTRIIQKHWSTLVTTLPDNIMKQLYSELPTATVEEEDVLSNTISKCSLCLVGKNVSISSAFSLDGKHDKYYLPLLFHQGQSYHVGCANFWSNVVQEELPVLN